MPVRTLVVRCPGWPLVAAGVPADAPAAVVRANRVVVATPAAVAEGVRPEQRRREAQACCPELALVDDDPDRDARAFEPVVAALDDVAPAVEVVRPGVAAFAAAGPARYFGGDDALVARVLAAVPAGARAGVADGPFAAELAAARGVVVPPGGTPDFLRPLPVGVLGRPALADLLRRLGLTTLGAFAALPPGDVLARFGTEGRGAHRLARGLDERPLAPRVPTPDLSVEVSLDPPAERVESAAFAARDLAARLVERLDRAGLACTRLSVQAETEHGERLARLWRTTGTFTAATAAERVRWQLDGWLSGTVRGDDGLPTAGVSLVRLVPDECVPADGTQQSLDGGGRDDGRVHAALSRVQAMLGPDAVVTAVPSGGRAPIERAVAVRWGDPREAARPLDAPWPGAIPAPSPAVVFPAPRPASVVDAVGNPVGVTGRYAVTAAPARVSVDGGPWRHVHGWAGPWPADERWWDAATARRRARFQVATADGGAWLLAVEDGRWWVEAEYD